MAGSKPRITASASNSLKPASGDAALQGGSGGMLLAAQGATDAAIKTQAEVGQVIAEDFRLANTGRRQHVIVVCTE
jgi:hypothetical protein